MSDQDELRDRIAYCLAQATSGGFQPGSPSAGWIQFAATHVIDEFGLTVETTVDMSIRTTDNRTGNVRYGEKTRIVGKWEQK